MAEEEVPQIEAIFPAPPPLYKNFTNANRDRFKELRAAAGPSQAASEDWEAHRLLDLPPELRCFVPPAPPAAGTYRSFGAPWDMNEAIPGLKDLNIEQLFPDQSTATSTHATQSQWTLDRAFYLKKIVRSILLNFLDLVGILATNPDHAKDKLADIEVLFLNAHHLINEYRPHQARESLILEMEDQLERKQAEIDDVKKLQDKVDTLIAELQKDGKDAQEVESDSRTKMPGDEKRAEEMAIWEALDSELVM